VRPFAALALLLRLRLNAWGRKLVSGFRDPKRLMLAVVGGVVFVPWLMSMLGIFGNHGPGLDVRYVLRFGPLVLGLYGLMTVAFATGDRALAFSPAEMNFLFPAPLTNRQLLAYKVADGLFGCLISSIFIAVVSRRNAPNLGLAFAAVLLAITFFHLLSLVAGLLTSIAGVVATTWRRRLALGLLGLATIAGMAQAMPRFVPDDPWTALRALENSVAVRAFKTPFRPFIELFAATSPAAAATWGAVSLAIVLVAFFAVFALNAQFLELSEAASARHFARLARKRQGLQTQSTWKGPKRPDRYGLPMPPAWSGAGPLAWRQATTLLRNPGRLAFLLIIFASCMIPFGFAYWFGGDPTLLIVFEAIVLGLSLFLTPLASFDFRDDYDRLAELKALPVAPGAMAVGQLLVPLALLTLVQWATVGAFGLVFVTRVGTTFWGILAMALPLNLLLLGIDNLMFLHFPARPGTATPGDLQAVGRQVVLMVAKFFVLSIAAGGAAALAIGVFALTGSRALTLLLIWTILAASGLAFIPLLARAFAGLDPSRDAPA